MKRFFYLIFSFSLFFNTILVAQSITWQRTYNSIFSGEDAGEDVCLSDNDNYFVTGFVQALPEAYYLIYVSKINKFGDTLWTRILGDSMNGGSYGRAIVSSGDGGCVITGGFADKTFLINISSSGQVIWQNILNDFPVHCYGLTRTIDGKYIACGYKSYIQGYVFKADSNGQIIWQKTYTAGHGKIFYRIINAVDQGYIAIGTLNNTSNDTSKGFICKLDTAGNVEWEKTFIVQGWTGLVNIDTTNNQYLISGRSVNGSNQRKVFLKRLSSNGNELYSKTFISDNKDNSLLIKSINRNKYILSIARDTAIYPYVNEYTKLIITDSLGNIQLQKNYYFDGDLTIRSILKLNKNMLLFTGYAEYMNQNRTDVYLLKTDSLFNAPSPIHVNNQHNNMPLIYKLNSFPNPFNPMTTIKYEIPKNANIKLTVYDITGKELITINEYKTAGVYTYTFDGTNLASGVYIYKVTSGDYTETKKMVLIK